MKPPSERQLVVCDRCFRNWHGVLSSSRHRSICLDCARGKTSLSDLWKRIKTCGLDQTIHNRLNFLEKADAFRAGIHNTPNDR